MLGNQVFYSDQGLGGAFGYYSGGNSSMHDAELKFTRFIQETQERNIFIYR